MIQNVPKNERIATGALAALLLGAGTRRIVKSRGWSLLGSSLAAMGAAMTLRSASGYCPVRAQLNRSLKKSEKTPSIERSILINRTATEVAEALGAVSQDGGPLEFQGERAHMTWNIRLEDYDKKRRTRLIAIFARRDGGFLSNHAVEHLITTELRNIKALLETGEIATVAGQSEGSRSFLGASITRVATSARRTLDDLAKQQQLTEAHV